MTRLKSKLLSLNADKPAHLKTKIFSPRNCEELRIPFKADKLAKVVGRLAELPLPSSSSPSPLTTRDTSPQLLTGVLVQSDFKLSLMAPEDLREYAGLTTTTIRCKQHLALPAAGVELIRWALEGSFGAVEELSSPFPKSEETNGEVKPPRNDDLDGYDTVVYLVMGCVTVTCTLAAKGEVEVSWDGNMLNDGIADAVISLLLSVESNPASVKRTHIPCLIVPD
jgi:cleavage and polyadenylation specificity factor subunit 3